MMDIETIVALNKEAGNKAKRHGIKPTTFGPEDVEAMEEGFTGAISGIVYLGNYIPRGWKRVDINLFSHYIFYPIPSRVCCAIINVKFPLTITFK